MHSKDVSDAVTETTGQRTIAESDNKQGKDDHRAENGMGSLSPSTPFSLNGENIGCTRVMEETSGS